MEQIRNKEYGGERPLFATHDLQLEDVTIHAGESALKECSNIIAINCCLLYTSPSPRDCS